MGQVPALQFEEGALTSKAISNGPPPCFSSIMFTNVRQEAVFRLRASDDHRRPGSESNPTRWSKKVGPTAFSPRGTRQGLESKRRWNKKVGPRQRAKRIRSKGLESRPDQWTAYREMSCNYGRNCSDSWLQGTRPATRCVSTGARSESRAISPRE